MDGVGQAHRRGADQGHKHEDPDGIQDELDAVAAELNGRPRQTLGWWSPSEKFAEAVAMIA
jgi:hypothetical protein